MTRPSTNDHTSLVAVAVLLALSMAVWEIDPRWITENVTGLTTREQGEINQQALGGSQRIIWLAAPLAAILLLVGRRLSTTGGSHTPITLTERPTDIDWLGLWVVWSLVGAMFGPSPTLAFGFTFATAAVVLGTRQLARVSPSMVMGAIVGGFALFVAISLAIKFLGFSDLRLRGGRLTLLSLEANQFGRFGSLTALAGFYLAFEQQHRLVRMVGGTVAVGALAALAMTGSRTGLIATALALGVLAVAKRNRRAFAGLAVAGLLAATFLLVTNVGRTALDQVLRDTNPSSSSVSSLTGRTTIWPVVLDAIGERPLSGHGLGTTTSVLSTRSNQTNFVVEHAHSLWLHLALTTGVIGLALLTIALTKAVRHAPPSNRPWVFALAAYFVVASISEAVLRNPDVAMVSLVLLIVLGEPRPAGGSGSPPPNVGSLHGEPHTGDVVRVAS